jgi:26S proteasome regulatory subunit N7
MGSDPQYAKYPNLGLAQNIFSLVVALQTAHHTSLKHLQNAIKEHKMAPLYRHLAHPTEGILNNIGEGTSQTTGSHPTARRGSIISSNLLPPRKPVPSGILPWDEKLYDELKKDNEKELADMQKEEDDAQENAGETEIQAVRGKRAEFWARVGDKVCTSDSSNTHLLTETFRIKPSLPMKSCSRRLAP